MDKQSVNQETEKGAVQTAEPKFRGTLFGISTVLVLMTGVVVYSPELYNLFCAATGYGGTTSRADKAPDQILEKTVLVRLDGTVDKHLDWSFKPVQNQIKVRIGEQVMTHFIAVNRGSEPLTGTASFNVTPEYAGSFFNKIDCFCFEEQHLSPGERVEMPVVFFIDPDVVKDREGRTLKEITLSYIFHRKKRVARLTD